MKTLNDYAIEILRKKHTKEELKEINSAVDELCKSAKKSEIKEFEESGAGDTLGMLLEYMD